MVDRQSAESMVKVLGIIYIVWGALGAFAGLMVMVGGGFMAALIPGLGGDIAGPIVMVVGILVLVVGALSLLVGTGLLGHKSWARIAGIVIGVLSLPSFPIGTAIGVFAIWLLGFEQNAIALFRDGAQRQY